MPVSLDDFPCPNPYFGVPYPTALWRRLLPRAAIVGFWLAVVIAASGLIVGTAVRERRDLFKIPLIAFVFASVSAPGFLYVYRRYEVGRRVDGNEVIPAQVESVMRVRPAAAAFSAVAFLSGNVRTATRALTDIAGVRVAYVSGGALKETVAMIDPPQLDGLVPGVVVWITRPGFMLHCAVVDKLMGMGVPQRVDPDAYRWFIAARGHAR